MQHFSCLQIAAFSRSVKPNNNNLLHYIRPPSDLTKSFQLQRRQASPPGQCGKSYKMYKKIISLSLKNQSGRGFSKAPFKTTLNASGPGDSMHVCDLFFP